MQFNSEGTYNIVYTATDECGNETQAEREVIVKIPLIYGAVWDGGSSPAWTRTDLATNFADPVAAVANGDGSSPFDDIMPWSGMQIVEDAEAGTLVSIPKYWYKWTRDGASMKLQISPEPQPKKGFLVSPAHADRGDGVGERDVVYVGRYHCASTYKSTSGVTPVTSRTRAVFRSSIHALGSDIWQYDYAMFWTIAMLYLVEYANWNSQEMIGYGGGVRALSNEGLTDAMQYHTGTNASTRQTYGSVQYRHIEGLWSNVFDWCDGVYFNGAEVYCIKTPANFHDTSNGVLVGTRASATNMIKAFSTPIADGFEYALYPNECISGLFTEYVCDRCEYGGEVLYVGGHHDSWDRLYEGLFYMNGQYASSSYTNMSGGRLMKLPSA